MYSHNKKKLGKDTTGRRNGIQTVNYLSLGVLSRFSQWLTVLFSLREYCGASHKDVTTFLSFNILGNAQRFLITLIIEKKKHSNQLNFNVAKGRNGVVSNQVPFILLKRQSNEI